MEFVMLEKTEKSANEFDENWQTLASILVNNLNVCQFYVDKLLEKGVTELTTVDTVYNNMISALHEMIEFFKAESEK